MIDKFVYCKKKGCGNPECQEHHFVPKCIGGTDKDYRNYLCKKHHDILHLMILKRVFSFVPDNRKNECRKSVENFGRWWIEKEW